MPCVNPPAHSNGDAHPSLRIDELKDTWYCDVCARGGRSIALVRHAGLADNDRNALAWMELRGLVSDSGVAHRVERFVYDDGQGGLAGCVERIEPGYNGQSKTFVQYRALPNGDFEKGLQGGKLPLYRRQELLECVARHEPAFFVEGERKCDRLRQELKKSNSKAGVTTLAGGAKAALSAEMASDFDGASSVFVLADSDEPGRAAAQKRAAVLARANPKLRIRVIDLFETEDSGRDIEDFFSAGRTITDLRLIVAAAPDFKADRVPPSAANAPLTNHDDSTESRFMSAADLLREPEELEAWIVEGLFAEGGWSLLVAKSKVGKSTLAQNLAMAVARGIPFLGRNTKQGTVLYLALEERRSLVRRHFEALGLTGSDPIHFHIAPTPQDADAWLARAVAEYEPILAIIDTLQRFTRMRDVNDYGQATNRTESSLALARMSGAHILFLHHAKKGDASEDTDAALGSTGIAGTADIILRMKKNDGGRRTLAAVTMREGDPLEESVIAMDPATFAVSIEGTRAEADLKAAQKEIRTFLDGQDETVERAAIAENVQSRGAVIAAALADLVARGEVLRTGAGKKGDSFRFCLSQGTVGNAETNPKTASNPHGIRANSFPAPASDTKNPGNEFLG